VAAAHMAERSRQAGDAETLIAAEVARFHERERTVNVAPAIVSLQRQAEEIRQAELHRMHAKFGTLNADQIAAVEALTRGLVNKFLHPHMQALKQAARENDSARVEALCDIWSLPVAPERESEPKPQTPEAPQPTPQPTKAQNLRTSETSEVAGR
jgi:glutamyl-tRNA reductase